MTSKTDAERAYMPQLDGLRALAIGFVVYSHFWPSGLVHDALRWGYIGVRLFFVISGFLITGILLDARERMKENKNVLKSFYVRRALRIFPIYYLSIFLLIFGYGGFNQWEMSSYLTYTTNWYYCTYKTGTVHLSGMDIGSHLWSLAIEEQFYLVWPWLILFAPRRWILPIILTSIALAPISRFVLALMTYSEIAITFNSFGCLDTLGTGALLAYIWRRPDGVAQARRFAKWSARLVIPLIVIALPQRLWSTHYVLIFTFQDILYAAISVSLVTAAAIGIPGFFGRLLGKGLVAYIGRISYGIYLYHGFAPVWVSWLLNRVGLPYPSDPYAQFAVLTVLSVAIAALSWHLLEKPINSLKKWFPYQPRKARPQPEVDSRPAIAPVTSLSLTQ